MLYQIMKHIRNFFVVDIVPGTFTIEDGSIDLSFLKSGQYFMVEGSIFNDGVYQYTEELELKDETFTGIIGCLNPDSEFLSLVEEIENYVANEQNTSYISESFGGYSYTKATGSNGCPATWKDVFRSRLNGWRRI